jgi:CelD/BcsL family acetyltransferase involved in cellulose biosynthesis
MGTGVAAETLRGTLASAEAGVRIETVSSESEFMQLAGSWDDLVRAMPRPSPFLLHGWLLEWWRHYGRRADLAVLVAYRGNRLIGALPLCIRRRAGLRVTEVVGGTWALLADVLIAPGEEAVAGVLAENAASSGHDFANLFGLTGSSRLVAALPPDSLRVVERVEGPVLDLGAGWDAVYGAKTSSKFREKRRRRRRQLEALGTFETSIARTREELEPVIEDVFRLYELRWHGRRDASGFVTPTGRSFHRAALLRLADLDVPRLTTIRVDGRAIAFALALQLSGRTYGLTMAFDPAYGRFSPGTEAKLLSLEAAAGEGITRAELLGAAAAHKQRFTDRFEPVYQGIGLARTLRGRAAAEALIDGIRLRRRIKRSTTAQRLYYRLPTSGRS